MAERVDVENVRMDEADLVEVEEMRTAGVDERALHVPKPVKQPVPQ